MRFDTLEIREQLAQKSRIRFEPTLAAALSSFGGHLCYVARYEEALEFSQRALKIQEQLAERSPKRFELDLAGSLSSCAGCLSNVGRYEEALESTRKALEICARLAKLSPERLESAFASLSIHYSSSLADVGRYDEALDTARQVVKIYERLAKKTPLRFTESLLDSFRTASFLEWLTRADNKLDRPANLNSASEFVPPHRKIRLTFYSLFENGYSTSDKFSRTENFTQAITLWPSLSQADKIATQEYFLCASGWCATYQPAAVEISNWPIIWHQFMTQRGGCLPHWILEFNQRMEFKWPTN